jgi:hypothetical protein
VTERMTSPPLKCAPQAFDWRLPGDFRLFVETCRRIARRPRQVSLASDQERSHEEQNKNKGRQVLAIVWFGGRPCAPIRFLPVYRFMSGSASP